MLYVVALKLDLALFTVYPSLGVVLLGTHHSRDIAGPSLAFLAPAMYWYGWTATAALGAFCVGLVAALLPERWTRRSGRDGYGCFRCSRWSRAFTSHCHGFASSQTGLNGVGPKRMTISVSVTSEWKQVFPFGARPEAAAANEIGNKEPDP